MIDKSRKPIVTWLLCGCFFIFLMVIIGGITRLTGSGLSITEWNVVMGAVPPMNEQDWNEAFSKYKAIPQFQKLNYDFTLGDFKKIFFWEYLHRLTGRLIGVVFLVPFIFFLVTRRLDKLLIRKLLILFCLGAFQGFLGWFMVKSGLSERTSVSHYRLAIHLVAAFITFAFTFWLALDLMYGGQHVRDKPVRRRPGALNLLSFIVLLQIIYGAFVAGLHAGRFANTFPTMDGEWIPAGLFSGTSLWLNFFENPVAVQFIHRTLAALIVVSTGWIWFTADRNELSISQKRGLYFLVFTVSLQFFLGVFTLLSKVNIVLASLHQVGAFILFSAVIFLLFQFRSR